MCLNPIRASFTYTVCENTGMPLRNPGRPEFNPEGDLKIPCGKCDECISKRAIEWATRAKHEISLHKENCFITLTYDNDHRPDGIVKQDFQKFIKRLRKKYKPNGLRYMVSYEYGSKTNLPHMHAILFGYNFKKQKLLKYNKGNPLFISEDLSSLWDKGFHSIAEANEKTAYYIASYALKGNDKEVVNEESGEINQFRDCMDVSKRPAIGLEYFCKNAEQIVHSGNIPRYYQKKLEEKEWCLDKFPEYEKTIKKFPELLDKLDEIKMSQIKDRSDHEIYSKFVIKDNKNTLHSSNFREDFTINKKDYRSYNEKMIIKQRLKRNRDDFAKIYKEKQT